MGTVINGAAIVVGGLLGLAGRSLLSEKLQETIMQASALAVIFIGLAGALAKMLVFEEGHLVLTGTMMMLGSLIGGAVIGEALDIEAKILALGNWLKEKSRNTGDSRFIDGFMTATLTVCIGAMAVVGSLEDGMNQDYSILVAKAILDLVIVMVMTAAMGKGCIFSAVPVVLFQGTITALAVFIQPLINTQAINNISYVGNMLIFCVGVNLFWPQKFRVANMLPALVLAVLIAQLAA